MGVDGVDWETKVLFIVPVKVHNSATLMVVIPRSIEYATTIDSDFWKAYDCLQDEGYGHLTVNFSLNCVIPIIMHILNILSVYAGTYDMMSLISLEQQRPDGFCLLSNFCLNGSSTD